jgi:hypothetical protein
VVATSEFLDDVQTMTLEAFAGVCGDLGAVEAGALELLCDPATGVTVGLVPLSEALNRHAGDYAERLEPAIDADVPPFVAPPSVTARWASGRAAG